MHITALSEIINNFWSARKRLHLAASYPTTKNYTNLYSFAAEQYTTSTYDNAGKLTSLKATPERYFLKSGNIVSKLGILTTRYIYLFVYARHLSVLYEKTLSLRVFKTKNWYVATLSELCIDARGILGSKERSEPQEMLEAL